MKKLKFISLATICLLLTSSVMSSCDFFRSGTSESSLSNNQNNSEITILNGKTARLNVGETLQLEIEVSNADKNEVVYATKNEQVATVSSDGLITAIKEGITSIIAMIGDAQAKIDIFVNSKEYEIDSIYLSIDEKTMRTGETISASISVDPEDYIDDAVLNVIEGRDLVSIEGNQITALKSGTAKLQAECHGYLSNVIELSIYDFDISVSSSIIAGEHERLSIRNYSGNKSDLKWWIEDHSIISLNTSAVGDIFVNGDEIGQTDFYLYNEDGLISNTLTISVIGGNPYLDIDKDQFYDDYTRATDYTDAMYRSECDLMSGWIEVPDQEPTVSSYQPSKSGKLIHNTTMNYSNNNRTYTVLDANGDKAFDIYYGAAYTSLEEVAAYIYAWGDIPINYTSNKSANPSRSVWGEYLRLNNSEFSGDTDGYPYEPELPDISGCDGNLIYYEIDIGTTGTDCDPKWKPELYNDGKEIVRGAARIVYSRYYADTGKEVNPEDRYVFYTYNHYNDFQEYLNYENGWGEMFGNITGGGVISSKVPGEYNPTPYVETIREPLN